MVSVCPSTPAALVIISLILRQVYNCSHLIATHCQTYGQKSKHILRRNCLTTHKSKHELSWSQSAKQMSNSNMPTSLSHDPSRGINWSNHLPLHSTLLLFQSLVNNRPIPFQQFVPLNISNCAVFFVTVYHCEHMWPIYIYCHQCCYNGRITSFRFISE